MIQEGLIYIQITEAVSEMRFNLPFKSQAISSADMVVVMDKGQVKWIGNSADLAVSSYSGFWSTNEFDTSLHMQKQEISTNASSANKQSLLQEKDVISVSDEVQEIIEAEQRKEGRVELTVYK